MTLVNFSAPLVTFVVIGPTDMLVICCLRHGSLPQTRLTYLESMGRARVCIAHSDFASGAATSRPFHHRWFEAFRGTGRPRAVAVLELLRAATG